MRITAQPKLSNDEVGTRRNTNSQTHTRTRYAVVPGAAKHTHTHKKKKKKKYTKKKKGQEISTQVEEPPSRQSSFFFPLFLTDFFDKINTEVGE